MTRCCENCSRFPWEVADDYTNLPAQKCQPFGGYRRWDKAEASKPNGCAAWAPRKTPPEAQLETPPSEPSDGTSGQLTELEEAVTDDWESAEAVVTIAPPQKATERPRRLLEQRISGGESDSRGGGPGAKTTTRQSPDRDPAESGHGAAGEADAGP